MPRVQTRAGGSKIKTMKTILQINLHCSKAAQSLLQQVATEVTADFILVSEAHNVEGPNRVSNSANKAVIVNNNLARIDEIGSNEHGFY